jgi:hypothetical protein
MALFVAEHRHPAEHCPTATPQRALFLVPLLSAPEAAKHGVKIYGEAFAHGQHHLYRVVDGPNEDAVKNWLAPFAQAGSLHALPASAGVEVVARGKC